jgi:glycosyltransferase involved in cell wall biosynthesis
MKLLLIAPGCNAHDVGESWVAYQWVRRLGARHDVTLLSYYKRNRRPAAPQLAGVRTVEWPEPPLVGRAERLNSLLKPGYLPFYWRARRWIQAAQARGERFDLAHQLVPVAMRYPCPASGLGIPVVLGPVGGSLETPKEFDADGDTAPWYVDLRSLDRARMRWDPWLRRTYDGASCVIGIAPYVGEFLVHRRIRRFEVMSETGIEQLPDIDPRPPSPGPVRLLYVGRIVRTKGLRDAIRAMSLLPTEVPVTLDVVGDGFDRLMCERLAAELGLSERIRFHGFLPREDVDRFYRASDVFVFPSYREPGGNVVFEAMGFGLPLVVSDRGGPGNVVDETSGIRVHATDPTRFAEELASALSRLIDDPRLRTELGTGARRRVAEVALWDGKVRQLEGLYASLVVRSDPFVVRTS